MDRTYETNDMHKRMMFVLSNKRARELWIDLDLLETASKLLTHQERHWEATMIDNRAADIAKKLEAIFIKNKV